GVQPLMSDSYGRGLMTDARKYLQYALVTAATVSVVIYAVIYLGAEPIVAAFNSEKDSALQVIAVSGLKIYFAGILLAGCNIVLQIFFTSVERPLPAQVISLLRGLLLIIPVAFLLAEAFGITGVWLAFPVTETVVAIIGCLIYTMDKRRSVK
ncbi:MAG: MATE family efflux transporter, partial [Firmicutes bacterium]|nr:MATE family efflux transporter [Bacillota bacterium]